MVRISVEPKVTKELPKMVQGMQRLDKSCPLVEVTTEDSGKHNVAGVGVEHMRILKQDAHYSSIMISRHRNSML